MLKNDEITPVLDEINIGDVFKSTKQLCDAIHIKYYAKGSSNKRMMGIINNCLSYEKEKYKYIITGINYDYIPKCDKKQETTKEFKELLCEYMCSLANYDCLEIQKCYSKTKMSCDILNIFDIGAYSISYKEDIEKTVFFEKHNNIDEDLYCKFVGICKSVLNTMIECTINSMNKYDIADITKYMHFSYNNGKGHVFTDRLIDITHEIEQQTKLEIKMCNERLKKTPEKSLSYVIFTTPSLYEQYKEIVVYKLNRDVRCIEVLNECIDEIDTTFYSRCYIGVDEYDNGNLDGYNYGTWFESIECIDNTTERLDYIKKRISEIVAIRAERLFYGEMTNKAYKTRKFSCIKQIDFSAIYEVLFNVKDFNKPIGILHDMFEKRFGMKYDPNRHYNIIDKTSTKIKRKSTIFDCFEDECYCEI